MKEAIRQYLIYLKDQLEEEINYDNFNKELSLRLDWIEAKLEELKPDDC
jgi:hypothetical protein